jgi:chromosome segregation ATPase
VPVTTRTDVVDYLQEVLIAEVCNYAKFLILANSFFQPSQVSFSTRIDELQEENLKLERELKQWKGQATAESEHRWRTDQELDQLKIANQTLQRELQKCAVTVDYFRKNTSKHAQVMHRVLQLMEELKTGTLYDEEGSGELDPLLYHAVGSSIPLGM